MRSRLFAVAGLTLLAMAGCSADAQESAGVPGEGSGDSRTYQVGDFTKVALGGAQDAVITVGGPIAVRAEGPSAMLDRLEVFVEDGGLKVRTRRNANEINLAGGKVTLYITMPKIEAAAIGGSGDMKIDKVDSASFKGSIGGSGSIAIAALTAGDVDFSIGGSGSIKVAGTSKSQAASIAGAGDVDMSGLTSETAGITIVGSGDVKARATKTADVTIMGSGSVDLTGGAECKVKKMGSGEVRCGA